MKIIAIIPARLSSTRLNEKVLADICGKPMIQHVYNAVKKSELISDVYVATDSTVIKEAVESFGGTALMTSVDCKNGTERIVELSDHFDDVDLFVNVQGDEPLIKPEVIDNAILSFRENYDSDLSTIATAFETKEEYFDPNKVKVIKDTNDKAIYFSRAPIPHNRDSDELPENTYFHIGLYIYKASFLKNFWDLKVSKLENYEKLEQLRFIENGYKIHVSITDYRSFGVDTEEDLTEVRNIVKQRERNG